MIPFDCINTYRVGEEVYFDVSGTILGHTGYRLVSGIALVSIVFLVFQLIGRRRNQKRGAHLRINIFHLKSECQFQRRKKTNLAKQILNPE
jgi:hypothetical protein